MFSSQHAPRKRYILVGLDWRKILVTANARRGIGTQATRFAVISKQNNHKSRAAITRLALKLSPCCDSAKSPGCWPSTALTAWAGMSHIALDTKEGARLFFFYSTNSTALRNTLLLVQEHGESDNLFWRRVRPATV